MIVGKYKATAVRVGLRVGVVCGPGEFPENRTGTVVNQQTNRCGTQWEVEMDNGPREWISAAQTNEMGIRWYAIGDPS